MCVRSRAAWSVIVSLVLCGCATATNTGPGSGPTVSSKGLALITEPQDGIRPVLDLIDGAHHSIDMTMYQLDDPNVEQALATKAAAGVSVRVLLQRGEDGNAEAMAYLTAHHVPVRYASARFALTHQKSIVIDGEMALIMTFNLTPRYYATSRDFGSSTASDPTLTRLKLLSTATGTAGTPPSRVMAQVTCSGPLAPNHDCSRSSKAPTTACRSRTRRWTTRPSPMPSVPPRSAKLTSR